MALTEAKVSCKCGKVVLKFFNPQPKLCLECGCVDCKQAMVWGQEQGGPKVFIKGHLISKCHFGVIVSTKKSTIFFQDFCPSL